MARSRKYRVITTLERINNRLTRFGLRVGLAPRAFALLETTGRRSGLPRHTPIGNGLAPEGSVFWIFAVHGTQADYVRNILKNPRVRVKIAGRWREGTATLLPTDDAMVRSRSMRYQWDAAIGRLMATRPMTIRVDLRPMGESRS
jgi:deazaflavin-dependent oxidoreductase (nitroreductase family)